MRNQSQIQNRKSPIPGGFTLVELLVVIVIIGIILGFIFSAALESVDRARERATQTLIAKLETGLNDRLDALLQTRPDYNNAHLFLAAIYNSNLYPNPNDPTGNNGALPGYQRATAIAWTDYIKSEMPDVFFVQAVPTSATQNVYPLNFAGNLFPGNVLGGTTGYSQLDGVAGYVLPLGNTILGNPSGYSYSPSGTGIFGASYTAAAGVYKNLGYLPQGYDGVDNNANGLIDEWSEGVAGDPLVPDPNSSIPGTQIHLSALIEGRLGKHQHATARSEMLYALLVEGRGPLGSVFNGDDFTDKEVQDTDGDGLPEFIDAWGQPLQFYRWPLLYHSNIQIGQNIVDTSGSSWSLTPPYLTVFQQREQNPLDQNQQLVTPAWWGNYNNAFALALTPTPPVVPNGVSGGVRAFEFFFHRLTEPLPTAGGPTWWDRGTTYGARRAFYSKFLIASAGPDQQLGIFQYTTADMLGFGSTNGPLALIANENNAMPFALDVFSAHNLVGGFAENATISTTTIPLNPSADPTHPSTSDLIQAAQDDISNQNIQPTGGLGGSGS